MRKFLIPFIVLFLLIMSGCSNNKYVVNFNTVGGNIIESQKIGSNELVTKPVNPIKKGYVFVKWQVDGKDFDFNSHIDSDIILDAIWESDGTKVTYTVEYVIEDNVIDTKEITIGKTAPEPKSIPSKTGYTFIGWYLDDADEAYDFDMILNSDIKLVAKFVSNTDIEDSSNDTKTTIFVTSFTIDIDSSTIEVGKTAQLQISYLPKNASYKEVEYSSSDTKIVTVSSSGLIKGLKEGKATITVKTTDGGNLTQEIVINVVKDLVSN